jgi:hypothetical protein
MENDPALLKTISYMKAHWPSSVKPEWQVGLDEYLTISKRILLDFTKDATSGRRLIRIAGLSGSGKTTQLLPAATACCDENNIVPVLVAARRFVEYHPHCQEIKDFYGEVNLRKMTDEFSTIMMFLILKALTAAGYDIILDVALLDPEVEQILLTFLKDYRVLFLMIATSPAVTEHFLSGRAWRHTRETEEEFVRATTKALKFYAKEAPTSRIILWDVYNNPPIYDGDLSGCLDIFSKYSARTELPQPNDDERRTAKAEYLRQIVL